MADSTPIRSLAEAAEYFDAVMRQHPERDGFAPYLAALAGRWRPHSGLALGHLGVPDDPGPVLDDVTLPEVAMPTSPEADLARDVVQMLAPLNLLNPVTPVFGLGRGSESMAPSFGIPLDPDAQNAPAFNKPIGRILAEPPPDTGNSGLFPEMRERIERIKAHLPPRFKIGFPGLQGPFNIAHAIAGSEAFTAPYDDPGKWYALMDRITTFWIEARRVLLGWIGEDRLAPIPHTWRPCITECSCNLVSAEFYEEFVLPHDRRIADAFGPVHIHPCSGPHVFHATLRGLPVNATEAGFIDRAFAGAISVDDALAAIGDHPILLFIGQELPAGREYEFICRDLDRYAGNPRLLFAYTGMHWRRRDRPLIRDIHRRLDAYWTRQYGNRAT
jgi:hypothetical protein